MNGQQTLCRHFVATGTCHFGSNCKFSHDLNEALTGPPTPQHAHKNPKGNVLNQDGGSKSLEATLRNWRRQARKEAGGAGTLGRTVLKQFFETAHTLVGSDPGVMQAVIKDLASDGGLERIRELCSLEINLDNPDKVRRAHVFTDMFVGFFHTITSPDVLASAVLESHVSDVYVFLYGPSGDRACTMFHSLLDCFHTMANAKKSTQMFPTLALSIEVMSKVMDFNRRAAMNEDLQNHFDRLRGVFAENETDFSLVSSSRAANLQRMLDRMQRQIAIALGIPEAVPKVHGNTAKPIPSFNIKRDLPGALSPDGPRHNNDFEDIREIQILPTSDEILATRTEYLPTVDSSDWHLPPGVDGLLDRHFRLLREDTVGQLRDAVRMAQEDLQRPENSTTKNKSNVIRTYKYSNVFLETVSCDRKIGLTFLISFQQLPHLQSKSAKEASDWWALSKRLVPDALVCVLGENGRSVFCSVVAPKGSHMKGRDRGPSQTLQFPNSDTVLLGLSLVEDSPQEVQRLMSLLARAPTGTRLTSAQNTTYLVEFPNILLPSFYPTLKALQSMTGTGELPFADLLVPQGDMEEVSNGPPAYALEQDFAFQLAPIMKKGQKNLTLAPKKEFDLEALKKDSILDDTQASSLSATLCRRLAVIQGPPGTGKSYTGVALIRVLLASRRKKARLGPIICVCYTNHALDQLLEHLLDEGISQIIRIGSRSKSERLGSLNLREVSSKMDRTRTEREESYRIRMDLNQCMEQLSSATQALNEPTSWALMKPYVKETYPNHYAQLLGEDEDGFQMVVRDEGIYISMWCNSMIRPWMPVMPQVARNFDVLKDVNAWETTTEERRIIYANWVSGQKESTLSELYELLELFQQHKAEDEATRKEVELRCLQQADVIGVTTSGLARHLDLLRRVRCKVLVCEEAGEVLEAHLLTALLPSIEHAILIGDHLQLRPQTNNYDLQYESPRGAQYSLDISLFERLVDPKTETDPKLPFSVLTTQRRMHPSISKIIRETLYPDLEDGSNVLKYPSVPGMKKRLFWFDHQHPEAQDDSYATHIQTTSRSNDFEVDMATALVSHLVRQGAYHESDIAVLTPYLGQLQKMRRKLGSLFEIVLNDRDQGDLDKIGLMDPETAAGPNREGTTKINGESTVPTHPNPKESGIAKSRLLNHLKVATIDNFQGEEAKVVVISLVRSNQNDQVGFLRTSNRINVLLSRAKHGMYIIGNSRTASSVEMWGQVLEILRSNDNVGPCLGLECPRHKNTRLNVSSPDDFLQLAPEGGCNLKCDRRLKCGHSCPQKCHSDLLHNSVFCQEPCQRAKEGCEHPCPFPCGQECGSKCQVIVTGLDITLACGHHADSLPCWQSQDTKSVKCSVEVSRTIDGCNHTVVLPCHVDIEAEAFRCPASCGAVLACGHHCGRSCHKCRTTDEEGSITISHGKCTSQCGRDYSVCKHSCTKVCHVGEPCPPCQSPCDTSCSHSKCSRKCSEPCAPCAVEKCSSTCPHSQCSLPCAAPCSWLPCSKRCALPLTCGHRCPSMCGEACPSAEFCQICATEATKAMEVDYIEGLTYGEIDLDADPCVFPQCGHVISRSNMDVMMGLEEHYFLDSEGNAVGVKQSSKPFSSDQVKTCPKCRGSLRNINRYGRIIRRGLLDEATKRFMSWAHSNYIPLATVLAEKQQELPESDLAIYWDSTITSNIALTGSPDQQIGQIYNIASPFQRYKDLFQVRVKLVRFVHEVQINEMPFMRVWQMVETARRTRGRASTDEAIDIAVPNATFFWKGLALLIRCDLSLLSDFITQVRLEESAIMPSLHVDFSVNREKCLSLVEKSAAAKDPVRTAEGHMFYAHFCALERSCTSILRRGPLRAEAQEHIESARQICREYPGSTRGIPEEITAVEKMLTGGVFFEAVSTQERREVLRAMAGEFTGTGHWYTCANGHPFTIGECGMPMELAKCPMCGSAIGGEHHELVEGVTRADELEKEFGELILGE